MKTHLTPAVRRNNSLAIGLLTASTADPASGALIGETLMSYIDDGVREDELVFGLFNIAGILLIRLEKMAGRNPLDELQYLAAMYGAQ